jgi:hypothetical protein
VRISTHRRARVVTCINPGLGALRDYRKSCSINRVSFYARNALVMLMVPDQTKTHSVPEQIGLRRAGMGTAGRNPY